MVKNKSHTLAYSLIALQEMNLAYRYPIIFWNCACLISDANGQDDDEIDNNDNGELDKEPEIEYSNEMEEFTDEDSEDDVEDSYDEDEDCDGYPVEIKKMTDGKKKKKTKAVKYGKIAAAIGKIMSTGVTILPPSINDSKFTFSPNVEQDAISYGLSGITRIGEDLVKEIIAKRPYGSINDFLNKIKLTKPQMVNLIKCGAFDEFDDRYEIMRQYIEIVSEPKKRVTLQNMQMLIDFNLIPDEFDMSRRVFNFNKYLKKINKGKSKEVYELDDIAYDFYAAHFDIDLLYPNELGGFKIKVDQWKMLYDECMDVVRPYIKGNSAMLLKQMNQHLFDNLWNKYCNGSLSKWEMDSISCYIQEHELNGLNGAINEIVDFDELDEEPQIDRFIYIKGKQIPMYRIYRIAGTVLDRDKNKKLVTLLTRHGVVTVKIFGGVFPQYDKQISERGADGKKHVLEKSAFSRGNKIIVTGIRDGEAFIAKTYKSTPYHKIELIEEIHNDGTILTRCRGE